MKGFIFIFIFIFIAENQLGIALPDAFGARERPRTPRARLAATRGLGASGTALPGRLAVRSLAIHLTAVHTRSSVEKFRQMGCAVAGERP
jgi:hypothetical protein